MDNIFNLVNSYSTCLDFFLFMNEVHVPLLIREDLFPCYILILKLKLPTLMELKIKPVNRLTCVS